MGSWLISRLDWGVITPTSYRAEIVESRDLLHPRWAETVGWVRIPRSGWKHMGYVLGSKTKRWSAMTSTDMKNLITLKKNSRTTRMRLFLILCYSGGWAKILRHYNCCWSKRGICKLSSIGRYCGSIYATAVLQALIKWRAKDQRSRIPII